MQPNDPPDNDSKGPLDEYIRETVRDELSVTDGDGTRWSLDQLLSLGLTRRQAIVALGAIGAGMASSEAIRRVLTEAIQPAQASHGGGSVGEAGNTVDVFGNDVDAQTVDVANETLIRASRSGDSSSTTAGSYVNAFDGEAVDNRGEFNASAQFVPDDDGYYMVIVDLDIDATDGDDVELRIRDTTGGSWVSGRPRSVLGQARDVVNIVTLFEATAGQAYEMQTTDLENSFTVKGGGNTRGFIVKSFVQ